MRLVSQRAGGKAAQKVFEAKRLDFKGAWRKVHWHLEEEKNVQPAAWLQKLALHVQGTRAPKIENPTCFALCGLCSGKLPRLKLLVVVDEPHKKYTPDKTARERHKHMMVFMKGGLTLLLQRCNGAFRNRCLDKVSA